MSDHCKNSLQIIREKRGLSRKEVSQISGVSLRSLQDYEQGHKNISSAKGSTIYQLSLALGCSMEDILTGTLLDIETVSQDTDNRFRRLSYYAESKLIEKKVRNQKLFSKNYQVAGRWILLNHQCFLVFLYNGELIQLPFNVYFSSETMPWLIDAAVMKMGSYIENILFNQNYGLEEGDDWDA